MRRLSLLQRFCVVSLVLVVALGALMAQLLATMISQRALRSATDAAVLVTVVAVQPLLSAEDLMRDLPADKVAALDRAVSGSRGGTEIARIKIWHHDGDLLYVADPHSRLPESARAGAGASHALEHAMGGEVEAELIDASDEPDNAGLLRRYGALLEVYVPIRYPGMAEPAGVFELYLPYGPVKDTIRADTRRAVLLLAAGLVVLWAALFRTVATASRRLRQEARRNEHQAHHDALTGLPNRTALHEQIDGLLAVGRRTGGTVALALLDLDRFREVNNTLGHSHGDALLQTMAERLRRHVGPRDVVARLGGDEFAVLLPGVSAPAAVERADRLRSVLREPAEVDGVTLVVEVSVGVSGCPEDARNADEMLRHADVALYVAKRTHTGVAVYDPDHDEHSPERLQMIAELARAVDAGELVLHYQAKCTMDGSVRGVEALVRWCHPERGLLPPSEFIPAAERTGLIHPLTEAVLECALGQARRWYDDGCPTPVAVNISTRTLLDDGFTERVLAHLAAHRVPASLLGLEITETAIMEDPDRALRVLTRLAAEGVRLSIDDFGTGYSSLAYLKSLPVHELKIDRSFVAGLTTNERDRVIVDTTVALGRRLGLEVVAEGVEDELTVAALTGLGCELAQGFFFSRPAPAAGPPPATALPALDAPAVPAE